MTGEAVVNSDEVSHVVLLLLTDIGDEELEFGFERDGDVDIRQLVLPPTPQIKLELFLLVSFSSRLHLARLLENQTWIFDSGKRIRFDNCSRAYASG